MNLKLPPLKYVIPFLLITMISCKKNDDLVLDYVGTWETNISIPTTTGFTSKKYSLVLTKHNFTETFFSNVYQIVPSFIGILATIEGNLSIKGNKINFTAKKISFSNINADTGTGSEPYKTYTEKDQDFTSVSNELSRPTYGFPNEFEIRDNQLILKVDYNKDNEFSDNEIVIYSRK